MPDTRWLPAAEAAQHIGLREITFLRRVRAGTLPQPSYALGPRSPRWDREALDAALGAEAASRDKREIVSAAVEAILAAGRQTRAARRAQGAGGRNGTRISVRTLAARAG